MKSSGVKVKRRTFISAALTLLTAFAIFDERLWIFGLFSLLFIGCAQYEFFTLFRMAKIPVYRLFGVAMGLVIPLVVFLERGATSSGEVLFIVLGCLFLFFLHFLRNSNAEALQGISHTLFGILYVSWFLSFCVKIRFLEGGSLWLVYLLVVTKAADIGAYLVGTALGKHLLIPHVSPKKSIEGLFGGIFASTIASVFMQTFLPLPFGLVHCLILGAGLGVVGQIGDLSESLMKRCCQAKDSGAVFPGMGGVLDTVDSILFTAPIFYFHLKIYL